MPVQTTARPLQRLGSPHFRFGSSPFHCRAAL